MFVYQGKGGYFAQAAEGTEELVAAEIERLGGGAAKTAYRGVSFEADRRALYRIVYASRLVTRVLAPLAGFDCHDADYLYKTARSLDWPALLGPDDTFAVRASVANSKIRHSGYAALKVKDAVADAMRERFGRRPNVERADPDLELHVRVHANHATILADASGGSLHRRGYRLETGEAPMRETVAAALLEMAGWNGERPLVDPMCGSGTILAEAWMRGCRIPAGKLRPRFGFERFPDFDRPLWEEVRRAEDACFRPLPEGFVSGGDADAGAVRAARANLARLPGGDRVRIERRRFQEIPRIEGRDIVSNPPYGIRSVPDRDMERFWRELGDFLKRRCAGSSATLYFGERQWIRFIGLRPAWKRPLPSGGLDGRAVRYELYEGAATSSRKEKSMAKTTFKGDPVETVGALPAKGAAAPDFTLVKGDLSEMSLAGAKGKRVVLNVFPSIDTPVCAASVRRFNEEAGKLANTLVLCVSMDLPFAAARFCGAEGLENVITLSDFRDGAFGRAYGLRIAGGPLAGLLARSVIVLDESGKVVYSELVPDIATEPDYDAALAVLR